MNIPSIINYLGENSFNSNEPSPWSTMLTSDIEGSDHNIASGLRHAWHHLQINFQDVATPIQLSSDAPKYLLTQPVSKAGNYHDGSTPKSATNTITIELERARMTKLGNTITATLPRDHYERLSWDSWQKMSAIPLHSPPDHIGYQDNDLFRMTISRYLGQKCPIIAPLAGRFFGKNNAQLDKYGTNLASAPLPGQGHKALHNKLQHILRDMMKLGNIESVLEAHNFLIDKVPQPYIGDYVNHVTQLPGHPRNARDAIVPDIHARNFPIERQPINDSGATRSADAIFEVKTFTICKSRYNHNNTLVNPANRRAKEVVQEYNSKFKRLDALFASDIVGDGTNSIVGPFQTAQSRFYTKGVIPLCIGGFG